MKKHSASLRLRLFCSCGCRCRIGLRLDLRPVNRGGARADSMLYD